MEMTAMHNALGIRLVDTHITAILAGLVFGETLSLVWFDMMLVGAMIRQRLFRVQPIAYLLTRYTTAIGITLFACLTITPSAPSLRTIRIVSGLRTVFLPTNVTATSLLIGYRIFILHPYRPRLLLVLVAVLLAFEFSGCIVTQLFSTRWDGQAGTLFVPDWVMALLAVAMLTDAMLMLTVLIPRACQRSRKGEVENKLVREAAVFGFTSIALKAGAIVATMLFAQRLANPYLPVRVQSVISSILACRMFRAQKTFLKSHRERTANPSLDFIDLELAADSQVLGHELDQHGVKIVQVAQDVESIDGATTFELVGRKATTTIPTNGELGKGCDPDARAA